MNSPSNNSKEQVSRTPEILSQVFTESVAILILTLLISFLAQGQSDFWQPAGGPEGGVIHTIAVAPNGTVYAGADSGGIYRSRNNGDSWEKVFNRSGQTTKTVSPVGDVSSIEIDRNGVIYVLSEGQILVSSNDGVEWTMPQDAPPWDRVQNIWVNDSGVVFAFLNIPHSPGGGLYTSSDFGKNFKQIRSNTKDNSPAHVFVTHDGKVFSQENGEVERSTDFGASWKMILQSNQFGILTDSILFNRSNDGTTFLSRDGGETWVRSSYILPAVNRLVYVGGAIFLFGNEPRFSIDTAKYFAKVRFGGEGIRLEDVAVNAHGDFFAATDRGVFRSSDGGKSWSAANSGIHNYRCENIFAMGKGKLIANMAPPSKWQNELGLYRSSDDGLSWQKDTMVTRSAPEIVASDGKGRIYARTMDGLVRSSDYGVTWKRLEKAPTHPKAVAISPNGVVFLSAGIIAEDLPTPATYRSDLSGRKWRKTALPPFTTGAIAFAKKRTIFIVNSGNIYRSIDNGMTAKKVFDTLSVGGSAQAVGPIVMSNKGDIYAVAGVSTEATVLYRSTDNGEHWVKEERTWAPTMIWTSLLAGKGDRMYGASPNIGAFEIDVTQHKFSNQLNTNLTDWNIIDLALTPKGYLLAGTKGGGIVRSAKPVQ